MLYTAVYYASQASVILPVLVFAARYNHVHTGDKPLFYYCCISLLSTVVGLIEIGLHGTNAITTNIYFLLDFFLLLWVFATWSPFRATKYIYLGIAGAAIWAIENIFLKRIIEASSGTLFFIRLSVLFLAVEQLNYLIVTDRKSILKNPRFLICAGLLMYCTINGELEIFLITKLAFLPNVARPLAYIVLSLSLFLNIIIAIAVLWMQPNKKFSLPY